MGVGNPGGLSDPELKVAIEHRAIDIQGAGDGNVAGQTPFSMLVNGKDLRSTIIETLVGHHNSARSTGPDPATMADEIMVTLGFASGYDEDGDYAPGYREYSVDVGLIQEDPKPAADFIEQAGKDLIEAAKAQAKKGEGTAQQQAKLTDINDNWGVAKWHIREDGVMHIEDDDGDEYNVGPDGKLVD
jgi:hypothetical protein